jgi:lysophospholipase L1-like esterase
MSRRPAINIALLGAGLAPIVYGSIVGVFWLRDHLPKWAGWQVGLIFLIALEIVYIVTVVTAFTVTLTSGIQLLRHPPVSRRASLGRRLLVCVSLLLSLIAAESASIIWQRRAHRFTAVPVGGLHSGQGWRTTSLPTEDSVPTPAEVKLPLDFADPPGDREIDLVTVGESSAQGVPFERWLSVDRIVAWQLQEVVPDRRIHVLNLARPGVTLEQQHKRLEELRRRPDLLIIYCGHNEFKARFAPNRKADHYFTDKLLATPQVLIDRLEELSPICGLIGETAEKCRISIPPRRDSERDLIDVPVYSTAEYTTILADFRRRLEAIVTYAERVGALPVLIVPPGNDAGFEPNRSFLPARTSRAQREAFRSEFLAARQLEEDDPTAGIVRYQELLDRQPGFAETHYRLARLLLRTGALEDAYRHFVSARDLDGSPWRCLTSFQDAYRGVAARHDCILIDGQAYFHKVGRQHQLDDDLFQDIMHPSLRGFIALSQAVLQALAARHAFGWPQDVPAPVIDPARLATHFGLDQETWKHIGFWQKGFNALVAPLRYEAKMRLRKRDEGVVAITRLSAGALPETLGLPNMGIPMVVPIVPFAEGEPSER